LDFTLSKDKGLRHLLDAKTLFLTGDNFSAVWNVFIDTPFTHILVTVQLLWHILVTSLVIAFVLCS